MEVMKSVLNSSQFTDTRMRTMIKLGMNKFPLAIKSKKHIFPSSSCLAHLTLSFVFILTLLSSLQPYHIIRASNVVPSQLEDIPVDPRCQPKDAPLCNMNSYDTVQPFNNTFGHTSLSTAIAELHKFAYLFKRESCKRKIELFLCSLYLPICVSEKTDAREKVILDKIGLLLPCRDDCEEARQVCAPDLKMAKSEWPEEWNCRKFNWHREDSMCVINNTEEYPHKSPTGKAHVITDPLLNSEEPPITESRPVFPPEPEISTETMCEDDLFDCRLRNPMKDQKAFCIDKNYVCNGKKDCVIDGVSDDSNEFGLDEVGCEKKCTEDQHYCDGKCINRADICNGKVDCSLGTDEQDCNDNLTGFVQSIFCVIALFFALYVLIRFIKVEAQRQQDFEEPEIEEQYQKNPYDSIDNLPRKRSFCAQENIHVPFHQQFDLNTTQRSPIYYEPTYSIMTRLGDYEKVNYGVYSGASSVYTSYDILNQRPPVDPIEPIAPPPTPIQDPTRPFTVVPAWQFDPNINPKV